MKTFYFDKSVLYGASHKKWEENTERYIASMKSTYQEGIQPFLAEFNHLIKDDTDSNSK